MTSGQPQTAEDNARDGLATIRQAVAARAFQDAATAASHYLEQHPADEEALYLKAVSERYLGLHDKALVTIHRLQSIAPDHGRACQEEGHVYRDRGEDVPAAIAYRRACELNPALIASWRERLTIAKRQGNNLEAQLVSEAIARLEGMPKPLIAVIDLVGQGKLLKAEALCRKVLQKIPHHPEAMRLLADIGSRLGVLDDAEILLEGAARLAPDDPRIQIDYIGVLRKRQKFAEALERASILLESDPDNARYRSIYAVECMQTGDYGTALACFDRVLEQVPNDPVTLTSKGHALKTRGNYEAAVASYRKAIDHHPHYGEAYYSLANLKVFRFEDDEVKRMESLASNPRLSHTDRVYLSFALGKAFEDSENFDRSFHWYSEGNARKRAQSRYDADIMEADLRAQQEVCTEAFFDTRKGHGHDAPDPIFIVGLPRAGSTLLEQILSSHSMVDGTLELPNVLSLSQELRRRSRFGDVPPYPEILETLDASTFSDFGRKYIEDTRIHRQNAQRFLDKMPNNFRHIGLIRLMLPNAKIIDARRHPMACCFSGFKQLFAEGQEFTYGLENVGRYYRNYVELMDHWDRVLPGFVLRVQYEDVVNDLETQVHRILEFCDLPFESACLEFHRTRRDVRTPSSEQVRQPIYKNAVEQWRHYEPHLAPLMDALGDLAVR